MNANIPPLAERMRPKNIADVMGQEHLLGENGILKNYLRKEFLPSIIFWGPPGVGKTTISKLLASEIGAKHFELSAINSGVKDVRRVMEQTQALQSSLFSQKVILFIDEIHRFSKSQQDSLLGAVEKGLFLLIGATTENPSFEVIPALLSRCQVMILNPIEPENLNHILEQAVKKDFIMKKKKFIFEKTDSLLSYSGGDVRKLLNLFELLGESGASDTIIINDKTVRGIVQKNLLNYDKGGEQHYNIISAFIKSIRGSDPNAAAYWLMRMLKSGEDPVFIARRLLILASEDIGLANSQALVVANSCFDAAQKIGYPECTYNLMHTTIYLATSVKSNSVAEAIGKARQLLNENPNEPVPIHLRNAPTKLMKDLGYGKEYKYSHSFEGNFKEQEYFPEKLKGMNIYKPQNNKYEKTIKKHLEKLWNHEYDFE